MPNIDKKNFLEAYRFLVVGLCSVSIDFIFYYLFIYFDIFDPNNAKRLSFVTGAIFAFFANRSYVFRVSEKKVSQFILFCLLYLCSFIMNSLMHDYVYLITQITLISFFMATAVSTITNFLGQKFIIFRNKNNKKEK